MRNAFRDIPAWGISLVVNLTILFALSMVVQSVELAGRKLAITSEMEEQLIEEEYSFSEATVSDTVGTQGDSNQVTLSAAVSQNLGRQEETPIERKIEQSLITDIKIPEMAALDPLKAMVTDRFEAKGTPSEHVTGGTAGVMDRLTLEIRRSLEENRTMVVWLFDASGSLNERREQIADRFGNIYKQLEHLKATDGLTTAIASYGESASLLTPEPVTGSNIKAMVDAVKAIQEDKSGHENVFTALKLCVEKYYRFNPGQGRTNKIVIIVTDERGDDFAQLEEVINLCKQYHFRVFCVGNGSVFGQQKGYVRWTYDDGFEEDIPVDQGPETAFAQVLQLPFFGAPDDWRTRTRMSAGYGPYTLTRLCAETGGMYLLTEESNGDRFDAAAMRNYAPDYRPVRMIEQEISKNGAMASLVRAASLTYEDGGIPSPTTDFRGFNDNVLREDLSEAQKPVAVINYKLEQLYRVLESGAKARPNLTGARWRASFDLAMGRILAMRVRLEGYQRMCAQMSSTPLSFKNPENNMWHLRPAADIDTGPTMRKAAEEAREYLKRVIDEHPARRGL
ncbi:MAG: VWA domain-containing protein [Planctomycetaceae bacterium]